MTFLIVFLIENTHNRDTAALQIKIDQLGWPVEDPHNALLDLEKLDDDILDGLRKRYERLASKARPRASRAANSTPIGPRSSLSDREWFGAERSMRGHPVVKGRTVDLFRTPAVYWISTCARSPVGPRASIRTRRGKPCGTEPASVPIRVERAAGLRSLLRISTD